MFYMKRLLCAFLLLSGSAVFAEDEEIYNSEYGNVEIDVENIATVKERLTFKGDVQKITLSQDWIEGGANFDLFMNGAGVSDDEIENGVFAWQKPTHFAGSVLTLEIYDENGEFIESFRAEYQIDNPLVVEMLSQWNGDFFMTAPYPGQRAIYLSANAPAWVYYTLDGSEPTEDGKSFFGSDYLDVEDGMTVKAFAVYNGVRSDIAVVTVGEKVNCGTGGCSDGSIIGTPLCSSSKTEVYDGFLRKPLAYDSYISHDISKPVETSTIEGVITVRAAWKRERISASVKINGKTYSFGTAKKIDDATYELVYKKTSTLSLTFCGNNVYGTVKGAIVAGEEFIVEGSRNRFKDKNDPASSLGASLRGQYNALVEVNDAYANKNSLLMLPGHGGGSYFTVKVSNNGSARVTAFLSDGTKTSVNSTLILFERNDGEKLICVPFNIPLYSRKGSVSGIFFISQNFKTMTSKMYLGDGEGGGLVNYSDVIWRRNTTSGSPAVRFLVLGKLWNANDARGLYEFSFETYPSYWYRGTELSANPELLPWGVDALYTGKTSLTIEKTESRLRLSVAKATGLITGSFSAFYSDGLAMKPRKVSIKVSGVMCPNRYGSGFISIPETNPIMRKNRKVNTTNFWLFDSE